MLTDKDIGNYLSYRFKLNELIHLHFLFHSLNEGNCGDSIHGVSKEQVLMSVRTVALAWFATVVDKNGLDIFSLWLKMYPQYQKRIELYRSLLQPHLVLIRTFRDRTAFHAQPTFVKFFEPRISFQEKAKDIARGVQQFLKLATFLIKREHTCDPNFYSRILGVVLDTELQLKCNINRRWLRSGLAAAKSRGKRLGRPRVIVNVARIATLRAAGRSWSEICDETGTKGTAQRALHSLPKNPANITPVSACSVAAD